MPEVSLVRRSNLLQVAFPQGRLALYPIQRRLSPDPMRTPRQPRALSRQPSRLRPGVSSSRCHPSFRSRAGESAGENWMRNAYPALGVDDHDHAGVCRCPGRTAYSCHLCLDRCADLGGLCGANGSGQQSSDANFDLVVVDMGRDTLLEARSPTSTGLVGMRLTGAGEDLGELLAGDRVVADLEEQSCRRLADN